MFELGRVLITPGIDELMTELRDTIVGFLRRHTRGDWGDICREDVGLNEEAVKSGARIISVYYLPDATKVLIITDGDDEDGVRHATTILLADEY